MPGAVCKLSLTAETKTENIGFLRNWQAGEEINSARRTQGRNRGLGAGSGCGLPWVDPRSVLPLDHTELTPQAPAPYTPLPGQRPWAYAAPWSTVEISPFLRAQTHEPHQLWVHANWIGWFFPGWYHWKPIWLHYKIWFKRNSQTCAKETSTRLLTATLFESKNLETSYMPTGREMDKSTVEAPAE